MPQDQESDKEKGLEKWLKQLENEPLIPIEETKKEEPYSTLTRRQLDNMVDPEEMEKEYSLDTKRLEQRKKHHRVSGTDYSFRSKTKYERY